MTAPMNAPALENPSFAMHRVRCSCQVENLVVYPSAWYRHQADQNVELPCRSCGKSLLLMAVPAGSKARLFGPETMPLGLAAAVSPELGAEITDAQDAPVDEVPLDAETWSEPHEPSPEYLDWVATLPAPAPIDRSVLIRNAAATGVLVAIVLLSLFF